MSSRVAAVCGQISEAPASISSSPMRKLADLPLPPIGSTSQFRRQSASAGRPSSIQCVFWAPVGSASSPGVFASVALPSPEGGVIEWPGGASASGLGDTSEASVTVGARRSERNTEMTVISMSTHS